VSRRHTWWVHDEVWDPRQADPTGGLMDGNAGMHTRQSNTS
jgi:hypothetical protein